MNRFLFFTAIFIIIMATLAVMAFETDDTNLGVDRVIDGDTLVLTNGATVRLARVDAPEWDQEGGDEATAALKRAVDGAEVRLVDDKDQPDFDKYDRRVAFIYIDERNVNEELIEGGFADYWEPRP